MVEFTVVSEKTQKTDREIIMVNIATAGGMNFTFLSKLINVEVICEMSTE